MAKRDSKKRRKQRVFAYQQGRYRTETIQIIVEPIRGANTENQPGGTNVDLYQQHFWKDWSATKSYENDIQEEPIGFACPIYAERNE
ncbi:hypothetical protein KIN20_037261 [Parelaphostrongylus tenuis]|uniref:Uncharacterized protein n=1 Tax=Parelaphostrongylus tenuis TaxID=148309 RepID=A0AAD5REG8_PARTN|nr:hypothetical protein KIN20_037261 [Parelaphostrongylus tenuis]